VIVVGIDCHMKTHTAVAVEQATGRAVGEITIAARARGHERLVAWAAGLGPERTFALEDCRHVSINLERFLIGAGERAVRVPTKLMAGARRSSRSRGKSDPIDAEAVARAAIAHRDLPAARLDGPERDLRLLVDHRESLVRTRTRHQSKLRWFLHVIDPEISVPPRALDRYVHLDRLEARLSDLPQNAETRIARSLVASCRDLTREANALEREIQALMRTGSPELLALAGCGELTGAKLLGEIAGISRFPTEAKLAQHAGVAPLEASSGRRRRHRLNRSGNRQLNAALHRIAITQKRIHPAARGYLERKQAEGKTEREALRCLKRQILRAVFRTLKDAESRREGTTPLTDTGRPGQILTAVA
jgi:transposase